MFRLPRDILVGFIVAAALAAALMSSRELRQADLALFNLEMRWLRASISYQPPQEIVVVGIDEQAYATIPEPYALWHRQLGALFAAIADARPAAVGLAVPLPVRSYGFIVKDIDQPLIAGLRRLAAAAPLVVGQAPGLDRHLRPIAPEVVAAVGGEKLASLVLCEDSDGIVRRISSRRCAIDEKLEPFAQALARHMGREGSPRGLIDYSVGTEIDYIPVMQLLDALQRGNIDAIQQRLGGRIVIVASLLPNETRFRLPVSLAGWDRGSLSQPGAVVHVQALRSLLGRGLIERVDDNWSMAFAALCTLLWFGRNGWRKTLLLVAMLVAILAGTTVGLWHGYYLPAASLLAATLVAFLARLAYESVRHYREKQMLRTAFAGHVSPQVMRAILHGSLQPDRDGERCTVTILFADIRGFTQRSAQATPEAMIELLNRFYGEAAAAIHARGGAIDKYIGDGLMATFGLPQPLPAPARNALEAAQDMLVRIARLNRALAAEGIAPLEIGIGIHTGEVLAGYVGSRKRRDFTVIGDPVNTASRLEGLTKEVGFPIVCSHAVATAVGFAGGLVDLGEVAIKGRGPIHAWGWNPSLGKRAAGAGARPR